VPQDGSAAGAENRLTSVVIDFGLEATAGPNTHPPEDIAAGYVESM
jgi:hypothetical protein